MLEKDNTQTQENLPEVTVPPTLSPQISLPLLRKGALLALFREASNHGPIIRLDGAFFSLYQVNDAAMVREVLLDKDKRYRKGKLMRSLSVVTGDGLLINDGDVWRRHRRLASPAFSPRRLDGYAAHMMEAAEVLMTRWGTQSPDEPVDVLEEMAEITLIGLLKTIFGIDYDDSYAGVSHVIHTMLEAVVRRGRSLFPLPLSFPTPANLRFRKQIKAAHQTLDQIMAARRASIQPEDAPVDLLGQWLQQSEANAQSGSDKEGGFTPSEMRDELMTMLIAGHHSLAIALGWSLYEIARHPEVQARWHAEVDALDTFPTEHKGLEALTYTRGIFLEALRFYPQPPILLRDAMEDHELAGYRVKKGDQLLLNALAIHEDEAHWPAPGTFDPLRYDALSIESSLQHHYLSFGGGSRTCIGRRFSIMEGTLLLARIAQQFKLTPNSEKPIAPRFAAMMVPEIPLHIKLERR